MAATTTSVAESLRRREARGARARRRLDRGEGRCAGGDRAAARASAARQILEANAADLADERAAGLTQRAARPADADRGADRGDGRRRAGDRRAAGPGRRGARAQDAGERARPAQGAGAARRRRRRLRGAAERDDRLRGADDQERQRDRPARLAATPSAPTGRWPRSCARRSPRPGCPRTRWCCSPAASREDLAELATQDGLVDLLIPRGGEGLKAALKDVATVPVMYAAAGNCHVYVHADADLEMARRIAVQRQGRSGPGVCNAAETLLVDAAVADELPARRPRRPARRRGRAGRRRAGARGRRRGRGRRGDARRTGTPSTST